MKYLVIVGDGMADRAIKDLGGKTPLEVAKTPSMDFLAREGKNGLLKTIPQGFIPSSDVANLGILGYAPEKYYPGGRGPFESLEMGAQLQGKEIVIRFNFITEEKGRMKSYSSGDLSTSENKKLVKELNRKLGSQEQKFYSGEGYRGVLVLKSKKYSHLLSSQPPHYIEKQLLRENLPQPSSHDKKAAKTAQLLNELMEKSKIILSKHQVNEKRISQGKLPGNMIWFWGSGKYRKLEKFKQKFKVSGAMLSAVTLLKGMEKALGLEVINVPGATSTFHTNYQGKTVYALKFLKKGDLVYLHVKAPDDLSHQGKIKKKIKAIEKIDQLILKKILGKLKESDFKIALLSDHLTSLETGEHLPDPVPFAIYSSLSQDKDYVNSYSEKGAKQGSYGIKKSHQFMNLLLKN